MPLLACVRSHLTKNVFAREARIYQNASTLSWLFVGAALRKALNANLTLFARYYRASMGESEMPLLPIVPLRADAERTEGAEETALPDKEEKTETAGRPDIFRELADSYEKGLGCIPNARRAQAYREKADELERK